MIRLHLHNITLLQQYGMIQYFNIALPQHRIAHCLDITLPQKIQYIHRHHISSTSHYLNNMWPQRRITWTSQLQMLPGAYLYGVWQGLAASKWSGCGNVRMTSVAKRCERTGHVLWISAASVLQYLARSWGRCLVGRCGYGQFIFRALYGWGVRLCRFFFALLVPLFFVSLVPLFFWYRHFSCKLPYKMVFWRCFFDVACAAFFLASGFDL